MSTASTNAALNELLINLGRSLLQYVGECWPWTDTSTTIEQQKIDELVERQRGQIERLALLLVDRDWTIEFGTYPTEYTNLHYVALDYLLDQLILNETALINDAEQVLHLCQDDPKAMKLVGEIKAQQQTVAHELNLLSQASTPDKTPTA